MKRTLPLIVLIALFSLNTFAKKKPTWHEGTIILASGDTLHCKLRLTRKVAEGLLQVTNDGVHFRMLTVDEVITFMYRDSARKSVRVFYSLQMRPESSGKEHGVFVESLYFNDRFGIVIHRTMGISKKNIQINPFRKKTIVENYYKVDRVEGGILPLTYHEALALLEKERSNIISALHTEDIRLRSVDDYRAIVTINQKIF
ncbi:MAG TPA: hypothetical protein VD927_09705 [Chryseosolibacter sp.]|nr:hypothetical protein [Chryseosolibacter sp.]